MQNLPTIVCSVVPHKKQRYPTAGDYFQRKGKMHFAISKMHAKHEFLILIHELVEWFLTQENGVSIDTIDKFDIAFEKRREPGNEDEPGDDVNAPYYHEHQFATYIERTIAEKMGVNWAKYDEHCKSL